MLDFTNAPQRAAAAEAEGDLTACLQSRPPKRRIGPAQQPQPWSIATHIWRTQGGKGSESTRGMAVPPDKHIRAHLTRQRCCALLPEHLWHLETTRPNARPTRGNGLSHHRRFKPPAAGFASARRRPILWQYRGVLGSSGHRKRWVVCGCANEPPAWQQLA